MVRRKKTTIFLDAKESTTVLELKKMIEGITKKAPSEQQLYNKDDSGELLQLTALIHLSRRLLDPCTVS